MTNLERCENCRFFVQYYYKDECGRYMKICAKGHCKHPELNFKSSDKVTKLNVPCDKFQPEEVQARDKNKLAINNLKCAEKLLSDTVRILKT